MESMNKLDKQINTFCACTLSGALAFAVDFNAHADVHFSFTTQIADVTVSSNQLAVDVFLQETLDGGSSSYLQQWGLIGAAFRIQQVGGDDSVNISDLFYGDQFNDEAVNSMHVSAIEASLTESVGFSGDPVLPDALGRIQIGRIVFDAADGLRASTWQIDLHDDLGGNLVAGNGVSLDVLPLDSVFNPILGGEMVDVVVPEPGLLGVFSGVSLCLTMRRRR